MKRAGVHAGFVACVVAMLPAGCTTPLNPKDAPVSIDATAGDASSVGDATAADVSNDTANAAPTDATNTTAESDASVANDANDSDANNSDASPSCGDTTSSAHNCGFCGHDCLGGTCSMALCQPVTLVTAAERATPAWLAQDGTSLYWTDDNNNKVYRTDKVSGGALVLTQSTFFPFPIAVDDAAIYWGDGDGIWQCPKAGCAAGPAFVAQSLTSLAQGLAVDQSQLYWTEENSIAILFAQKSALDASPGVLWQSDTSTIMWSGGATSDFYPEHVATDGQRVYFTASDGRLRAVALDGGEEESTSAVNQSGSFDVALDTGHVYWSVPDPNAGFIAWATIGLLGDAGAVTTGLSAPTSIATDGTSLYWAAMSSDGNGAEDIFSCTIAACRPTRIAGGVMAAKIVVDAQAVYWTDHGTTPDNGAIWKLAK